MARKSKTAKGTERRLVPGRQQFSKQLQLFTGELCCQLGKKEKQKNKAMKHHPREALTLRKRFEEKQGSTAGVGAGALVTVFRWVWSFSFAVIVYFDNDNY